MLQIITSNISTIIIGGVLLGVVIWITKSLYHDKKTGKSSCGCGCSGCGSSGICHDTKNTLVEQYKANVKGV